MQKLLLLALVAGCFARLSYAQYPADDWADADTAPPFEVYTLASGMRTVDPPSSLVIQNPTPGQDLGFAPDGFASGSRVGFAWRHENVGLIADLGFHKYSDHIGSTSLAPLMLGLRFYSHEQFRTSFFGEGLAGAYRWTEKGKNANFTTVKGILAAGGGIDIRLTRSFVFRVGEIQLILAGGGGLTESASSGFGFRF